MTFFAPRHPFSVLELVKDCFITVMTVLLALWLGFSIDRTYNCEPTPVLDLNGTLQYVIPCSKDALDHRANTAMTAFLSLFGAFVFLAVAFNLFTPYNVVCIKKRQPHCNSCQCEGHAPLDAGQQF